MSVRLVAKPPEVVEAKGSEKWKKVASTSDPSTQAAKRAFGHLAQLQIPSLLGGYNQRREPLLMPTFAALGEGAQIFHIQWNDGAPMKFPNTVRLEKCLKDYQLLPFLGCIPDAQHGSADQLLRIAVTHTYAWEQMGSEDEVRQYAEDAVKRTAEVLRISRDIEITDGDRTQIVDRIVYVMPHCKAPDVSPEKKQE